MRSRSSHLAFSTTAAAVLSGLLVLGSADSALAQGKGGGKPPAKPAVAAAAKPAAAKPAAAKPAAAKPAAAGPTKAAAAKPKLNEKQKKEAAKKLFGEAKVKFEKGDYAGALPLYQEADGLIPGARPKYQAAYCLDKLGQPANAVAAYQKFLASSPDADKFKTELVEAKGRIAALETTPAKVRVATDPPGVPGLRLTVDGAAQPGPELTVSPGKHTIAASAAGYDPATQTIEVKFDDKRDVTLVLQKSAVGVAVVPPPPAPPPPAAGAAPAPPPPKTHPHQRSRIPAYVTLGLAGAGAVVGTIFGVQALGSKSDFNATPTSDLADKADRNALIADMSFAVALTFGVTGAVLLLSGGNDEKAAPAGAAPPPKKSAFLPMIMPYVGPKAGGAAATLRF